MSPVLDFLIGRYRAILFALEGWQFVLRHERNAWVHALASICVSFLGLWLGISRTEWLVLIIMVTLVWLAEFLNTAIEAIVDLASPGHHPLAKIGKDVGAAAVLVAASSSILVGIIIFGPPALEKIKTLIEVK